MHPEPIAQYMPEAMERMRAGGFDLCIANDGDADRVGIIDERGTFINQLQVMALLMMYLIEKRGQKGDVVRSLTSTSMVDKLGERFGVKVHELKEGFKYYLEDGSWVLVRFSGTEPLIRVYSEASSKERVEQLLGALEEKLGLRQLV